MLKIKNGPTAYFDVDDTLVMWNNDIEEEQVSDVENGGTIDSDYVEIECREHLNILKKNPYNIQLLKRLSGRGHNIVVWSAGGSDWAEAVVLALGIESYVDVVTSKPTYYIDDIKDPTRWMGKHSYINEEGIRYGNHGIPMGEE